MSKYSNYFLYSKRNWLIALTTAAFLLPALAFASGGPYAPGATLDPGCLPADNTCVVISPSSTNQAAIFIATSSSATSTFAGNTAVSGNASSTNATVSKTLVIGSLSGVLKAVGGVVNTALVNLSSDITGVLGVTNGGIGTSTAPTYGQLLVGNVNGGYDLVATSSLGIAGGSSQWTTASSNIYYSTGSVGIGTTSPAYALDVNGTIQSAAVITKDPYIDVRAYGAKGNGVADDTAAITAAIAASAGRTLDGTKRSGEVFFPCGTYNFTGLTITVPVILQGDNETCTILKYTPTSGTAITENYQSGLSDGYSPGLRDIDLSGSIGNYAVPQASTGLLLGGTNGAHGFTAKSINIDHFGLGLTYGNNSYLTIFQDSLISKNNVNFIYPSGLSNSGENIAFQNTTFADSGEFFDQTVGACIQFTGNPGVAMAIFDGGSFDDCHIDIPSLSASHISFTNNHFETPGGYANVPNITLEDFFSTVTLTNPDFYNGHVGAAAAIITATAGTFNATGIMGYNTGTSTIPLIALSGTANANVFGTGRTTGYSKLVTNTGTGHVYVNDQTTGNIGIGTTSPSYLLDVNGFINTNSTGGGYKIDGSSVLYASSTNLSTFVGILAGAGYIASATSSFTGNAVTAIGYQAMQNATSTINSRSTAVGFQALQGSSATITGVSNVAFGYQALRLNSTGSFNSAFGLQSLSANTSGASNMAIGVSALSANTSGNFNTAVGANALQWNQTGGQSTAVGFQTGGAGTGSVSSYSNGTFLGYRAGFLQTGNNNVFLGAFIASTTVAGNNNIALGYDIALPVTSGSNQLDIGNLIFGTGINGEGTTLSTGSIGIGSTTPGSLFSIGNTNGINFSTATTTFSSTGGVNITSGCFAVNGGCIGLTASAAGSTGQVQFNNGSSLAASTLFFWDNTNNRLGVGTTTPGYTLDVAGLIDTTGTGGGYAIDGLTTLYASSTNSATFVGQQAGAGYILNATSSFTGNAVTAIGYQAMQNATSTINSRSTAVGYQALRGSTTNINGTSNSALGFQALTVDSTGSFNSAFGYQALLANTSGGSNVAVGLSALAGTTGGNSNTAIGTNALQSNANGNQSVAIGQQAGNGNASFNNGTFIGFKAGVLQTGNNNIFLGFEAASTTTSGNNNIALGYDIALPLTTGGNQLDIGNIIYGTGINGEGNTLSTGNIAIGTSTPYAKLSVWGADSASSTLSFNVVNSASTTVFAVFNGGNAQLSGTLTQSSDARLKTNILTLDASSSLSAIEGLNPVTYDWLDPNKGGVRQYGFIAQQVQTIFPSLVATTSATALTPDGTLGLNYSGLIAPLVKAVQLLASQLQNLESTVSGFAQSFTSDKVTTKQLCVEKSDGTTVCISGDQLAQVLSGSSSSQSQVQVGDASPITADTTTPPTIKIQGENPAHINVGDTYTDLGALVTDNMGHDLSYQMYLNGTAVTSLLLDTSAPVTDTIDYVATDTWGNTSTSTRTVIIAAPATDTGSTASSSTGN